MSSTSGASAAASASACSPSARLADDDVLLQLQERAQPLAHDGVIVGDQGRDHGSRIRGAPSSRHPAPPRPEPAAGRARPLGHRRQPQPSRAGGVGVDAAAVVADGQLDAARRAAQRDRDPRARARAGAGVAQRVVQRLLRDPERVARDGGADRLSPSTCREISRVCVRRSTSTCVPSAIASACDSSAAGRRRTITDRSPHPPRARARAARPPAVRRGRSARRRTPPPARGRRASA
jgi:hypothetical protein